MKELARQLDSWPVLVLISGMTIIFSVPREAVADEVSLDSEVGSESDIDSEIRELQELLTRQASQLAEQQALITTQQDEIDKQRALLQSVQARLDQLTPGQVIDRSIVDRSPVTFSALMTTEHHRCPLDGQNRRGSTVEYKLQTAVDSKHHLIPKLNMQLEPKNR